MLVRLPEKGIFICKTCIAVTKNQKKESTGNIAILLRLLQIMQVRLSFWLLIFFSLFYGLSGAQTCSTRGQTPATAFPVCGNKVFEQTTVPNCSTHVLQVPGCDNSATSYQDLNPFWYKFTCYKSGSLGFTITPNDLGDDYDWELFDITGRNPDDVFTDNSLTVTGNWSGSYGITGARQGGSTYIECSSDPADNHSTFSYMPNIIEGHNYLLLISHFTDSQSGYGLSFDRGTASIIQVIVPQLKDIQTNCEETQITLLLNKRIQCSSLAADGSDFSIDAPGVKVIAAMAPDCRTEFDADSLILTLNAPLIPGNYNLVAQKGTDGNTLLDNCDFELAEGSSLPLSILPKQPTPFDSIAPVTCAPQVLELVFSKPIRCESIAANGSDFTITGTGLVSIDRAYGNCDKGVNASSVFLHLSQPITSEGTYTVTTQTGIDGNVVINECGEETPAAQSVSFHVKDTVSSQFTTRIGLGCKADTVMVLHDGSNGVSNWQWTFDSVIHRAGQTATVIYNSYGTKTISLITTNGFCSDTSSSTAVLDNELKAAFLLPDIACPDEAVTINDTSIGNIISYQWDFGNGNYSTLKSPLMQNYPQAGGDKKYPVTLIVENDLACTDTLSKPLFVAYSCHLTVPTAFTPNGDGVNDYLYPLNAYKATNLLFTVYNRLGQIVFQTKDRLKKWDGTFRGEPQGTGTYVWTLQFTAEDTKQFTSLRGTSVLIR